jgi:brefeldin A-inhibited guanine nucleotide-exchange protein
VYLRVCLHVCMNVCQLRGRILALELLLSVLTNPGPVFRNNDVFISLVKKDLCLPLSKSGISPNRT